MRLIILVFVLLLLIPGASALTKTYDPSTKTISIMANTGNTTYMTIQQVSLDTSLIQLQEVFLIHSNINYNVDPSTDFIHNYQEFKGNNSIYKVTWEINQGGNWNTFNPVGKTLTAGSNYLIRLTLYKKAETGTINILSIPRMRGLDLPELTWWNTSWFSRVDNPISNGTRPYQIPLNLSNSSGTNNATHVFCNGHCNPDFSDIRFLIDNTTILPYWIESISPAKVWVNVTINGTVNMYYNNPNVSTASSASSTFSIPTTIATGGTITYNTNAYAIHTFTSNGSFNSSFSGTVDALVIGGGGSGGNRYGAGGGAGGYQYIDSFSINNQNYSVVIGEGGASQTNNLKGGYNGSNSSFSTIIAYGGGRGAGEQDAAGSGGSGGGAVNVGSVGTGYQGGNGGSGGGQWSGGGGGGASENGQTAPNGGAGGKGGNGTSNSINGTNVIYAGGGGGASYAGSVANGGTGGGGNAASNSNAQAGTDGLGGGGGATGGNSGNSGKGGNGTVIIRYINRRYSSPEPTWATWSATTFEPLMLISNSVSTSWASFLVMDLTNSTTTWTVNYNIPTNITWKLNNSIVKTINNTLLDSYVNSSASIGNWNITATGINAVDNTESISISWMWILNNQIVQTAEQIIVSIS